MSQRGKNIISSFLILAIILCMSIFFLSSCKDEKNENDAPIVTDSSAYLSLELSEYISVEKYTDLDVTVKDGKDKATLLMKAISDSATVIKYPEEQVNYYYEETRKMYLDLASGDEDRYEEILNEQNVTEESMLEDARNMVKNDLIFYYIVKDADITLTEEEKSSLYEQYVDYYVDTYKYSESYVKENMSSLIYDSMLYDKTMEYLILNNNFIK